jgi:hypothetical protein
MRFDYLRSKVGPRRAKRLLLEALGEGLVASGAAVTLCHPDVIQAHRVKTYSLGNYPARVALGPDLKGMSMGFFCDSCGRPIV